MASKRQMVAGSVLNSHGFLLCGWRVANTIPVLEEGNGRTDTLRERRSVDYDWLADVALGQERRIHEIRRMSATSPIATELPVMSAAP
jgi:hypothetical protein